MSKSLKSSNRQKIIRKVARTISDYSMIRASDKILVGVSGGPDSVALLHLLIDLAPEFSFSLYIAHLNHSIRGQDSDRDAEFVKNLSDTLNIRSFITKIDVPLIRKEQKLSIEDAARKARYDFFFDVLKTNNFDKIALAHHMDDNAELVLMNLFRGAGMKGISGIMPVRDNIIIRPFLNLARSEIIDFADSENIKYTTDKSNFDLSLTRNRIRHELLPLIKKSYNPSIIDTLNRFASVMMIENEWVENLIDPLFQDLVKVENENEIILSLDRFLKNHEACQGRVLRRCIKKVKGDLQHISHTNINDALFMIQRKTGYKQIDLPKQIRIACEYDQLIITKDKTYSRKENSKSLNGTSTFKYLVDVSGPDPVIVHIKELGLAVEFSVLDNDNMAMLKTKDDKLAFFNHDILETRLIIRNTMPGDRFTPFGMKGTQKLKDFFINNKVSRASRKKSAVIMNGNEIIWVIGHRAADTAKVSRSAEKVLKAQLILAL